MKDKFMIVRFTLALGLVSLLAVATAGTAGADGPPTQTEIQAAIDQGVAWLVEQQNEDGSWGEWGEFVAHTGFAAVKLADLAFERGYDPFDPAYAYSQNVIDGLNCRALWWLSRMTSVAYPPEMVLPTASAAGRLRSTPSAPKRASRSS